MDKVNVYLEVLKKHHFWVLCAIVLIAGFVADLWGSSFFAEKYTSNMGRIESTAGSVERVSRDPTQPNEKFAAAVMQEHEKLQSGVDKLWTDLYQKQESVLVWPDWIDNEEAKQILAVSGRRPGGGSQRGEKGMPEPLRREYQRRIQEEFDPLFEILELRKLKVDEDEEESYEGLVFMAPGLEESIRRRYQWNESPDEHKVLYTQEDLWVYRALFEIIKTTNGEASDHIYAPVKAIESLDIAQAGNATPVNDVVMPEGMKPKVFTDPPTIPSADDSGEEILDGRYVKEDGKPLMGTAAPPFKEFNLIPVQMVVLVDQHRIADLLAACANSPVPFEIRRVRINPEDSDNYRKMPGNNEKKDTRDAADKETANPLERGYYDIPVEIHGVIFIRKRPEIAPKDDAVAAAG